MQAELEKSRTVETGDLMSQAELERLAVQARARITWGESQASVRDWLAAQGITEPWIDKILILVMAERSRSIRHKGLWDLFIGLTAIALGIGLAYGLVVIKNVFGIVPMYGVIIAAGVALYGLYRILGGIARLILGGHVSGHDSDVN